MDDLLKKIIKVDKKVKRNVVKISKEIDAFSSLIESKDEADIARQAITSARRSVQGKESQGEFYYTSAIEYPFITYPYMQTRYSDGSYPVWYGSTDTVTSIYETAYHSLQSVFDSDTYIDAQNIIKKRNIFDVRCTGILLDIVGQEKKYPKLVGNNYQFTNKLGKEVKNNQLQGIFSTSARHKKGCNLNIFNKNALSAANLADEITYEIDLKEKEVYILGCNTIKHIRFDELNMP